MGSLTNLIDKATSATKRMLFGVKEQENVADNELAASATTATGETRATPLQQSAKAEEKKDELALDAADFTEGSIINSVEENSEQKVTELNDKAVLLSDIKEAHVLKDTTLDSHDEGYVPHASVKGLDTEKAVAKESDLVRSYFLSDAFKQRAAKSLGYDNVEDMTPEHRKTYDDIVKRGKELSVNFRIGFVDKDLRDTVNTFTTTVNGVTSVAINPEDKGLGISILTHELAHHLYNPDNINPGVHSEERKYGGNEQKYGKEKSPLNTINESDIRERRARMVYKGLFQNMSEFASQKDDKALEKYLREYANGEQLRLHDSAGFERAADVHGVRMLMMQEGIWNPFTGDPVTEKQVKEFRQQHPDSRIFEYWNNKEATYYLNNIACNEEQGNTKEASEKNLLAKTEKQEAVRSDHLPSVDVNALLSMNYENEIQSMSNRQQEQRSAGMHI